MQRLTKQPMQALEKLEQPRDSWSNSTLPHHVCALWRRWRSRNSTDTREKHGWFQRMQSITKHKIQPVWLLCIFSFELHHAQHNKDLGVSTSCAEAPRSLGRWQFRICHHVANCLCIRVAQRDCLFSGLARQSDTNTQINFDTYCYFSFVHVVDLMLQNNPGGS